jgi:hypothetical protein
MLRICCRDLLATPSRRLPFWWILIQDDLPKPRLKAVNGVVMVSAYTDRQLRTMADGPTDPNAEPLDQNQLAGSAGFFSCNMKFITRKLWGLYNSGQFGHSGKFTTMREAITLGHNGEAGQYETLLCEAGAIGLVGIHSTVPAMQVSRRRLIRLGSAVASAQPLSVAVTGNGSVPI